MTDVSARETSDRDASEPSGTGNSEILQTDIKTVDGDIATQDGENPRSPKRRRLSPPVDDIEIDFEAAAARALAISLGEDSNLSDTLPPAAAPSLPHSALSKTSSPFPASSTPPPSHRTRIENLPALDNVATEILSTLAKLSHLEIGEMLFGPPSLRGQDYRALKARFEETKRPYLTTSPFIPLAATGFKEAAQIDTIRKTNMATFMASIFSGEIGLRIMDMNFLDVFVPEGGRLLKAQASIYLELKTHAFIAAKRTAPAMLNQVMLDLFPLHMDKILVAKRPGAKSLAPSETDFLKRLASRRDILYGDMRNNKLDSLELRYRWDDFSREVNNYLTKNFDLSGINGKDKSGQSSPVPARAQLPQDQMQGQFSLLPAPKQAETPSSINGSGVPDFDFDLDSFMEQAARAAEIALYGGSQTVYNAPRPSLPTVTSSAPDPTVHAPTIAAVPRTDTTDSTTSKPQPSSNVVQQGGQEIVPPVSSTEFQQYRPPKPNGDDVADDASSSSAESDVPHKSQTAPTQVLYERARLVAVNKVAPPSRKGLPPSHRRPWTNEEENALMTGLDQVKGPHWAQILAMYGPGGTINESLKDRNQVQLKDKARNLKLFFLKAGIEVPYYLQAVTGDLKTRAPAQAEKREALEKVGAGIEEGDNVLHQDEVQVELGDDFEHLPDTLTDQEDFQDSTPNNNQVVEGHDKDDGAIANNIQDVDLDVDAMIAQAAASVTQSLGESWS